MLITAHLSVPATFRAEKQIKNAFGGERSGGPIPEPNFSYFIFFSRVHHPILLVFSDGVIPVCSS